MENILLLTQNRMVLYSRQRDIKSRYAILVPSVWSCTVLAVFICIDLKAVYYDKSPDSERRSGVEHKILYIIENPIVYNTMTIQF